MKTREQFLRLYPRHPWIGWGLGVFYLSCACLSLLLIPIGTAMIWIAMTSPLLIIADELCAAIEITPSHIVRRSPLSPRLIIPWVNVKRAILVANRKNNRLVYIQAREPLRYSISFNSNQKNFRDGLRVIFEIAEANRMDIEIKGLSRRRDWKQWAYLEN
ncbi:MAG: hypothetical protein ACRC8Y_03965 [Chroococcales cyanobacterium]